MKSDLIARRCIAFGVPFTVGADCEAMLEKLLERTPLGTQCDAAQSGEADCFVLLGAEAAAGHRFVLNDEVVAESFEAEPVLEQFARCLMVHVANHAPDRVFVHAGVIGWGGQALVLPGISFAGKTTLVAALVRAGATYYSDEYAVVDERGLVHPYARELQMRQTGSAMQRSVAVEQLQGTAGTAPLPVSRVVFTEYAKSGRWKPVVVSAGMAVLEMLRHAIPVQRTPSRVMATLARMMETATALRSPRGEASEVADLLLREMSRGRASL